MFTSDQTLVSKLRTLTEDMERLNAPGYIQTLRPKASVSEWFLTPSEVLTLSGNVAGHPELRDGPFESSQLYYFNQELGLARTLSRWFRLKQPLLPTNNWTRQ